MSKAGRGIEAIQKHFSKPKCSGNFFKHIPRKEGGGACTNGTEKDEWGNMAEGGPNMSSIFQEFVKENRKKNGFENRPRRKRTGPTKR